MLEELRLFLLSFQAKLIVESYLANAVMWVAHLDSRPWGF